MTGSGVNNNAGRFIKNNDPRVLKHDGERDFLGDKRWSGWLGNHEGNPIPGLQLMARFCVSVINPSPTVSNQSLYSRSG